VARKYFIQTFGCQMNFHDAERLSGLLESRDFIRTDDEAVADVVVVNTCSVRERAEEKLYTRLGEIRANRGSRPRPVVAVTGCVAQQEGEALLRRDRSIDVVAGSQSLARVPDLVTRAMVDRSRTVATDPRDDISVPIGIARHSDPVRAWVTIIEGCNEYCAFCVVPYTRGHERMRPSVAILEEVRRAAESGRCEIQLLGQIVNHYQAPDDPSCDFAELLERVGRVPGVARVRFASPHPRHVGERLMAAIRDIPAVCKHLHLPVQSGSDRILGAMRRRHTRDDYFRLVDRLRQHVPGIALSTDMIVGFPGETAQDFADTIDLVRRVRYHAMYSFKYSPRPNTLAMKRMADDVTEADKTARILELQATQRAIQSAWHEAAVGQTETVLIDAVSKRRSWEVAGRTSGNTVVNLPGPADWLGRLLPVRITGSGPNSLRGEALAVDEVAHAR